MLLEEASSEFGDNSATESDPIDNSDPNPNKERRRPKNKQWFHVGPSWK